MNLEWARVIKQVYETDPLVYPRCGGTMKTLAVIERQMMVREILGHPGLPTRAPRRRAPPDQPTGLTGDQPREWSREPLFDNLPVPDPLLG